MTAESKALPEFESYGVRYFLALCISDGEVTEIFREATEADLSAVLPAMDHVARARVLAPYLGPQLVPIAEEIVGRLDQAIVKKGQEQYARAEAAEQALAAERAKVAELTDRLDRAECEWHNFKTILTNEALQDAGQKMPARERMKRARIREADARAEADSLRATLAKVEAERDGLHAFLREHEGTLAYALTQSKVMSADDAGRQHVRKAQSALLDILATLPKGTKE